MNNFTYDNTKRATHVAMCLAGFPGHQFYSNIATSSFELASKHTSFLWEVIYDSPSYELIELSRPHSETREYWTTNDVTQYAQGDNMSTDKLIPISYVKKFTPLIVGDVLYNSEAGLEYTINGNDGQLENCNDDNRFNDRMLIVSFADRPNTGKQPVGDDVMIDADFDYLCENIPASSVSWEDSGGTVGVGETWKPNHAAMLKQYQAERAKGEMSEFYGMLGVDGAASYKSTCEPQPETPTFTQAMDDAGESPPVGSEFEEAATDNTMVARASFGDYVWATIKNSGFKPKTLSIAEIKPIQTAEDKAVDAMCYAMEMQNGSPKSVYKRYSAPVIDAIKAGKVHGVKWVGK